jgi:choline dehydrogenase-like flavoprotein
VTLEKFPGGSDVSSQSLCQEDFAEIRHYGGISLAWPISHDDLEPYYTQAGQFYHESGPLLSGPAAVLIQIAESCEREARRIFEFLGNQKSIMNDVLANVIDAHGGLDRWKKLNSVTATIFNGGRPTGAHRSSRDGAH